MAVDPPPHAIPAVAQALLAHYDRHARVLPWRSPPGESAPDSYRVWLSEIMLQQTTVAAVIPYFRAFTTRWPTVEALAGADEAELMAAWAGLGYYARARNLIACARVVAREHGGRFPDSEEGLRALPGIGAYTAAAIAAIAFGRRAVVVDANVERVVSRLFAIDTPLPASRPAIREAADRITPDVRAGDFAQAMMDLGSGICTVRNPICGLCPLREHCIAGRAGNPTDYPVKPPKKAKPERVGTVWWIEAEDHVWLVRRPDKGLLGGMRAFPASDFAPVDDGAMPPVAASFIPVERTVGHVFTHFALTLRIARAQVDRAAMHGQEGEWWPRDRLEEAGLPTVFAKVVMAVLATQEA